MDTSEKEFTSSTGLPNYSSDNQHDIKTSSDSLGRNESSFHAPCSVSTPHRSELFSSKRKITQLSPNVYKKFKTEALDESKSLENRLLQSEDVMYKENESENINAYDSEHSNGYLGNYPLNEEHVATDAIVTSTESIISSNSFSHSISNEEAQDVTEDSKKWKEKYQTELKMNQNLNQKLQQLQENFSRLYRNKNTVPVTSTSEDSGSISKEKLDYLISASISYCKEKKELLKLEIDQISPVPRLNSCKASLSPGSLADVSSESVNSSQILWKTTKSSTTSSSTTLSITSSSCNSSSLARIYGKQIGGAMIQSLYNFNKPSDVACICSCFCNQFVEMNRNVQPNITTSPEVSNSSLENESVKCGSVRKKLKSERGNEAILKPKPPLFKKESEHVIPESDETVDISERSSGASQSRKVKSVRKEKISQSDIDINNLISDWICPNNCKFHSNLYVFAMWPRDSQYYPGIVENSSWNCWQTQSSFNVKFFDGKVLKASGSSIFPAIFIKPGASIMYEIEEGNYEPATLISLQRNHITEKTQDVKSCIYYSVQLENNEIIDIPFYKIAVSESYYKALKKNLGSSILTPMKPTSLICSGKISTENLLEGKRQRRKLPIEVLNLSDYETSPTSSSTKKRKDRVLNRHTKERAEKSKISETSKGNKIYSETPATKLPDSSKKKSSVKIVPATSSKKKSVNRSRTGKLSSDIKAQKSKTQIETKSKSPKKPCSLPSTSVAKKAKAVREIVFRNDVVPPELSDSESEIESIIKLNEVCGGDLDSEFTPCSLTSRKSVGDRRRKTSLKANVTVPDDLDSIKNLGPIPKSALFEGYSFVITHAGPNSYYKKPKEYNDDFSSDDKSSSYDYTAVNYPFDIVRLRTQITAGKGMFYTNILDISKENFKKTILISDGPCQTPNYLLSAALNISVYSHELIISCCSKNIPIGKNLKCAFKLPAGKVQGLWYELDKSRKGNPLKDFIVMIASTETNSRLHLWAQLLKFTGAKVGYITPERYNICLVENAGIIIADDYFPKELKEAAVKDDIPVVNPRWLIGTVIRGKREKTGDDEYQVQISDNT